MNNENIRPMSMSEHQELLKLSELIQKNNEELIRFQKEFKDVLKTYRPDKKEICCVCGLSPEILVEHQTGYTTSLLNNILEYIEGEISDEFELSYDNDTDITELPDELIAEMKGVQKGVAGTKKLIVDYIKEAKQLKQ